LTLNLRLRFKSPSLRSTIVVGGTDFAFASMAAAMRCCSLPRDTTTGAPSETFGFLALTEVRDGR